MLALANRVCTISKIQCANTYVLCVQRIAQQILLRALFNPNLNIWISNRMHPDRRTAWLNVEKMRICYFVYFYPFEAVKSGVWPVSSVYCDFRLSNNWFYTSIDPINDKRIVSHKCDLLAWSMWSVRAFFVTLHTGLVYNTFLYFIRFCRPHEPIYSICWCLPCLMRFWQIRVAFAPTL